MIDTLDGVTLMKYAWSAAKFQEQSNRIIAQALLKLLEADDG
jgi:hypothetical protein